MANSAKQTRIERFLALLADHLKARGLSCRLLYDDARLGNVLVAAVLTADSELCEIVVQRQVDEGVIVLCAESAAAARALAAATEDLHKTVKRVQSARRAFLRKIGALARVLAETYEARRGDFPTRAFEQLQSLIPTSRPLVGVEGLYHRRAHDDDALAPTALAEASRRERKVARRYPSRFAALVPTPAGPRAALYDPRQQAFRPRGDAQVAARQSLAGREGHAFGLALPSAAALALAAANSAAASRPAEAQQGATSAVADVVQDVVVDGVVEGALELGSSAIEVAAGGVSSLADCSVIDCASGLDCAT